MVDIRQTSEYANYLSQIGWIVERKEGVNYFIKKLPLMGSLIKIQRPEKINTQEIEKLTQKHKAFQIVFEPKGIKEELKIKKLKFKISRSPYLPTKTLFLRLSLPENKLLKNLKKDCRLAIKKNAELRIKNYELKKLKEFRQVWKKSVSFRRYIPPLTHLSALKKSFGKNALFICDKKERGGGIFLKTKDVAYYWQAFTNEKGRKSQVQYKIVWEAILWAKKTGCTLFDFEGTYDERFPNESWRGFTHFKKSFGGKEFCYPGCFVKYLPWICK